MAKRDSAFIEPMTAMLATTPPSGPGWLHEIKFDGWRAQVHINSGAISIYGRNGGDLTTRFRRLLPEIASLSTDGIIDAEVVALDTNGRPDFMKLMREGGKAEHLTLWCFDLLVIKSRDLRQQPLAYRRQQLADLINRANHSAIRYSGSFTDGQKLLTAAAEMGLEGIVSKRSESRYHSGRSREWIKTKTAAWRTTAAARVKLFERKR